MIREDVVNSYGYKVAKASVDYSQKYAKDDELQGIVIDTFEDAAKFGYNLAIEKACEWLHSELDKEEERHYIHVHGFDKEHREIFLEDFRKAMKGGEKLDADKVIEWLKPYSVIEDNISRCVPLGNRKKERR